jgi:hypothetical protein
MGRDITPICKHNLNIKNIKTLAEDLFLRLDINIEYPSDELFWSLDNKKIIQFKPKSTVKLIKDDKFDTYFLIDDKQYEKLFIERYENGMNELYRQHYWDMFGCSHIPSNERIEQEKHELIFNSYDLTYKDDNGTKWLNIYNYCVNIHIPYYARWWGLCKTFNDEWIEYWNSKHFLEYRKSIQYYSEKLGGTKVYFLDDQSDVLKGVGQGSEWDMTWEEIEKHILDKSDDLLLNISQFILDNNYRKKWIDKISYNGLRTIKYEYPLAFVDDFKDL